MGTVFDDHWRKRALAGDSAAVSELAHEHVPTLFAFCIHRVGKRRDLCEEVVQETMVRAIRDLEAYDPARAAGNIFGWLTGLARNEIQRVLARDRNAVSLEMLWERMDQELLKLYARLEDQPLNDEVLRRQETTEMVNATMSQLPPHYRRCLEAKYMEGQSVSEMAGGMGMSEKAVESLLTRARQAFRGIFRTLTAALGEPDPRMKAEG